MNHITMNKKEREQLVVFEKMKNNTITQTEASSQLGISTRWIRKKFKRYLENEAAGIIHKNRDRPSNKRWNENEKAVLIDLLQSDWHDFGPSFAAQKLKELKNINVSKETVRQTMIKGNLWQPKREKIKHRKRRERRAMIGGMTQFDGSKHKWFEERGEWSTLLVHIDDATSTILWLEFATSESLASVMAATKNYMKKHGRPLALYVDFGSSFSVNLNNLERDKKTQWERCIEELSVVIHHAHSPQAKGRVERANKTLQDRLVKELRLAKISTVDDANKFLLETDFIAKHNQFFAVPPAQNGDAHRSIDEYN